MKASTVTLHFGRKGSGKSYTAKRCAEKAGRPVSVWDPTSDWAGPGGKDKPRMSRVIVRDMMDFLIVQARNGGRPVAQCVVFQLDPSDLELWCSWILRAGNQLVIIDEAQLVAPPSYCPPRLYKLVTTCRHINTDLLVCCQRPSTVSPHVRAQADVIRSWHMIEPLDLKWISTFCGPHFAKTLPKLGQRKFSEFRA